MKDVEYKLYGVDGNLEYILNKNRWERSHFSSAPAALRALQEAIFGVSQIEIIEYMTGLSQQVDNGN